MGKPTGFKEFTRELPEKRPVEERIKDFNEIYLPFPREKLTRQAARCMDCGVPTCISGCPLGNLVPDWNDAVYHDRFEDALKELLATNNFPEFTGRLCPAPCEEACVLSINEPAVTIEQIEKEIIEHAFARGWIRPEVPAKRTGKQVAVVGSGPSGLAAAQQLNRAGHQVTVFEKADRIGGLLRYGIPDFKMKKCVLDRRLEVMAEEGIVFQTDTEISGTIGSNNLKNFDAVLLCLGAGRPLDLNLPGRDFSGIYFAMDFLTCRNRVNSGYDLAAKGISRISAENKDVVVIGGGDTASDCVGTCLREKARSVVSFDISPVPGAGRPENQPWPYWPNRLRTSSSHEEGGTRYWSILTKQFIGENGCVSALETVDVRFSIKGGGDPVMEEIPGTRRQWPADLVLLAIGFKGPETVNLIDTLGIEWSSSGNVRTDDAYMTNVEGIFAAGDARFGPSLIVRAISEGREAARAVDIYLMGESALPGKGCCDLPWR